MTILNLYLRRRSHACNLQQLKRKLVGERCQQSIELVTFSEDQVYDELSSIDITKASGPDELHGRLLKEAAPYIARSLSQLFAKSMSTGCLPRDWKIANVTPIHKKESCHQPGNYRPVSLTSLIIKVMERIVTRNIRAFLQEHGRLSPLQHGFRPRHSCLTQLLEKLNSSLGSGKVNPRCLSRLC